MVNNTQFFNSYVNNSSLIQLSNDSKNQNSQTISNTLSDYNNIISDNSKQKLNNINKKRFDEEIGRASCRERV